VLKFVQISIPKFQDSTPRNDVRFLYSFKLSVIRYFPIKIQACKNIFFRRINVKITSPYSSQQGETDFTADVFLVVQHIGKNIGINGFAEGIIRKNISDA